MQILLIRHVLVSDYIWIVLMIPLGKLLVPEPVGNYESKSQDQDDHNLVAVSQLISLRLTSAIREIMQTITPVV